MDDSSAISSGASLCWYVAYGSNMDLEKLARWISPPVGGWQNRWVRLPRRVRFAGASRTWGGAVAFLDLQEHSGHLAHARAVLISETDLDVVFRRENGVGSLPLPLASMGIHPGECFRVPVERTLAWQGKYETVLRLEDLEGQPAYTLTTSLDLEQGAPSDAYVAVIMGALAEHLHSGPALEYRAQLTDH